MIEVSTCKDVYDVMVSEKSLLLRCLRVWVHLPLVGSLLSPGVPTRVSVSVGMRGLSRRWGMQRPSSSLNAASRAGLFSSQTKSQVEISRKIRTEG